ncbi:MAG: NACHT domain-containing NTPase [Xenococcaceae cyanobacterium]
MSISSIDKQYKELKTELKICKIGGLFLALYRNQEVPELVITLLENDLEGFFQFRLHMDEQKVPFPIFFEQSFQQMGKQSNIFHILGIENLSSEAVKNFLGYLQYGRERLKAKPYSLVFWITPDFEKELFLRAPDFHHWVFGTYDFTSIDNDELNSLSSIKESLHFREHPIFVNLLKRLRRIPGIQSIIESAICKNGMSPHFQNIDKYLKKVVWQYKHWQEVNESKESFLIEAMGRADLYNYYVPSYCIDQQGKEQLLDKLLANFIKDDDQNFLTLLGDFGTGKSSFSIHYFMTLAEKYLANKNECIPIFISLKDYRGRLNLEEFMVREFYSKFKIRLKSSFFKQLALKGKFIFFIDGFDEMASLTDQEITIQNLKELTKLSFEYVLFITTERHKSYKANKVFLTSRTHYFLTESQEQNILRADYTILGRNYATRSDYEITRIKLKEFNENQIKEYIHKKTHDEKITAWYLKVIHDTYNLKELSTRPLLLEMLIKTIDELNEKKNINTSDLYRAYTNIWIERDDWRSQMTPQGKRSFMWEMATRMFELGGDFSLHYSKLSKPKDEHLKPDYNVMDQDYYKYEATTCTFLNRDFAGNYKFIHKSFMEYFIAESFYSYLRKYKHQKFKYLSLNNEMKFFLKNIIALHKYELDALDMSNFELSQIDLSSGSLDQTNLESADLSYANLESADLESANLESANLKSANLESANLDHANLINTKINEKTKLGYKWRLVHQIVNQTNLKSADLKSADLKSADLESADLKSADLESANLKSANLKSANLESANLKSANLKSANLESANLESANLDHANLINTKINEKTKLGYKWRLVHQIVNQANLFRANLESADLSYANLESTDLFRANLFRANLESADLSYTNLESANLFRANLESANLSYANLESANLSGAYLTNISWNEQTNWKNVTGWETAHNIPEALKQQLGF